MVNLHPKYGHPSIHWSSFPAFSSYHLLVLVVVTGVKQSQVLGLRLSLEFKLQAKWVETTEIIPVQDKIIKFLTRFDIFPYNVPPLAKLLPWSWWTRSWPTMTRRSWTWRSRWRGCGRSASLSARDERWHVPVYQVFVILGIMLVSWSTMIKVISNT